jgi:hypothetical protein
MVQSDGGQRYLACRDTGSPVDPAGHLEGFLENAIEAGTAETELPREVHCVADLAGNLSLTELG